MQDLLLDTAQELDIKDGDFVVSESTLQHQELLIITNKGEWKENPMVAVGAEGYLKDNDEGELMAEIKKQFQADGMQVNKIFMTEGNINTDARY